MAEENKLEIGIDVSDTPQDFGRNPDIPAEPAVAATSDIPEAPRSNVQPQREESPRELQQVGTLAPELERASTKVKSQAEIEEENWQMIRRFQRTQELLYSRIIGVEPGNSEDTFLIITSIFGMRVAIPDEYFFVEYERQFGANFKDLPDREKYRIKYYAASRQIGARICFLITNATRERIADDGYDNWQSNYTYGIVGSRVAAMELLRDIWFFHKRRRADNRRNARTVKEGDYTKANVLYVREDGVRVECFGVETYISAFELSGLRYVTDCRDEVKPGDVINVRVRRVHMNGDDVYVSVSGRLYDVGYTSRNIKSMKVSGFYSGVVRNYNNNSGYYTINLDNGVIAAVHRDSIQGGNALEQGDEVYVRVRNIYDEIVVGDAYKI